MYLVDSHCHVDSSVFDLDRENVIERAFSSGVIAMLNVATGSPGGDSFEKTIELARSYDQIFASVGIHPHDAKEYSLEVENRLIRLVKENEKIIAWGEIGLDFYYNHSPQDVQIKVFRRQIEVAIDLGLPIIVHSRNADDETLSILLEYSSDKAFRGGIMHCFGGSAQMAEKLVERGFLISFAGNVTFKNAENLRRAAGIVPIDKLLVETDSPFLAPVPVRGRRCEPSFVRHTAEFLAKFRGINFDELAYKTTQNFLRFFMSHDQSIAYFEKILALRQ